EPSCVSNLSASFLKMARGRLVRAYLVSGNNQIKRNRKVPLRDGKQIAIDVREDADLVFPRQSFQRRIGVLKRSPSRKAFGQEIEVARMVPKIGGDTASDVIQHLPVPAIDHFLIGFVLAVQISDFVAVKLGAGGASHLVESCRDSDFPIDQCAVAVK